MKRIIIVEDDPGIQELYRTLFMDTGHDVIIYSDANMILHECHEPPDLYIIDKQLSGIDGLEICRRLKSQESTMHIPVIMLSASPSIIPLAKLAGADDAIEKPFSINRINQTINKYLD